MDRSDDADLAIQNVLETAAKSELSSSWAVIDVPRRAAGGESKVKSMAADYGRKQRRASSSPPPHSSSSSSSLPGTTVRIPRQRQDSNSSTSSSSSSREGSYNISNASTPVKRIQSSEKLANQIRQMLPPRRSPDIPRKNSLAKQYADKGGQAPVQNGNVASLSSNPVPNGGVKLLSGPSPLQNGDVTLVSGPIPIPTGQSSEQTSSKAALAGSDSSEKGVESPPAAGNRTSTSYRGSVSSECQSSEGDLDSSIDLRSPLVKYPHPALADTPTDTPILKSGMKSLPSLTAEDGAGVGSEGRKGVAKPGSTKSRSSTKRKVVLDDIDIDPEEAEDQLNEMGSFPMNIRSRTQTLSALTGGKRRMEIGRKKLREHRSDMKRFSSMTTPLDTIQDAELLAKDKLNWKKELELLSPLLQAKIRNMTLKKIYAEYGGKDIVTKAVSVIEEAYRTYKLQKRFQERLKEKRENRTMQRKRAQSLRQPNRHPSIMSKERRYRAKSRDKQDPLAKSKEAAERLAKERLPHAHSGARQELMEKRRSEVSLDSVGSSICQDGLPEEDEEEKDDEVFETKAKRKPKLVSWGEGRVRREIGGLRSGKDNYLRQLLVGRTKELRD